MNRSPTLVKDDDVSFHVDIYGYYSYRETDEDIEAAQGEDTEAGAVTDRCAR